MGVSITWAPVATSQASVASKSALFEALQNAFGNMPMNLERQHVGTLKGIRACGHQGADELIDAIHKHGEIQVDASW